MATAVVAKQRPKVNPDRVFFPVMCLLVLITVWLGFSKTYYAIGMVRATLPSPVVHIHAIVFSLWLVTLVTQTLLVTARKVKLHMTLGLWGFGLAGVMVVLGLVAACGSLQRNLSPPGSGLDPRVFFVVPISDILIFAALTTWSYLARRRPMEHKRLIMLATITLLDAAIGRFPTAVTPMGPLGQTLIFFAFLLLMIGYDIITLKKVHRATWIASLLIAVVTLARIPLAQTGAWMKFAGLIHG
jgi:hypothetical protein